MSFFHIDQLEKRQHTKSDRTDLGFLWTRQHIIPMTIPTRPNPPSASDTKSSTLPAEKDINYSYPTNLTWNMNIRLCIHLEFQGTLRLWWPMRFWLNRLFQEFLFKIALWEGCQHALQVAPQISLKTNLSIASCWCIIGCQENNIGSSLPYWNWLKQLPNSPKEWRLISHFQQQKILELFQCLLTRRHYLTFFAIFRLTSPSGLVTF